MFLVLKIGSRFFTFISSSKPTLHSLMCSLPVCRSPLETGFLIICSQTDLHLCLILSSLPSSWTKFFFLNLSPTMDMTLTTCHCPSFFGSGSTLTFGTLLSALSLVYFVCLEFVSFEFSQAKLLSSTAPCAQSTWMCPHTTCCLCTWLVLLSPCIAQVIVRGELQLLEKEAYPTCSNHHLPWKIPSFLISSSPPPQLNG